MNETYTVYAIDADGEWKPIATRGTLQDLHSDYGVPNVRPIGDDGRTFALHEEEKRGGVLAAIAIRD